MAKYIKEVEPRSAIDDGKYTRDSNNHERCSSGNALKLVDNISIVVHHLPAISTN